jgi:arylformamidase
MIDISWPLQPGMTSYKNRHALVIEQLRTVVEHGVTDSRCLALHMHAGTHVDAPSHFIPGGKTIEQLSLTQMNGRCRILDLTAVVGSVRAHDLESLNIQPGERILLKTSNSFNAATALYSEDEIYVAACAAAYLANKQILLLGVDGLGLERNQPRHESHVALFNAGIVVVEGLRLADAQAEGNYILHLLPLAFVGTEAAPARAVLELV